MSRSEIAVNKFKEGYCCSQAVLFSFAGKAGIAEDLALRIADGLGAGMARKQEVCGAVSGSVLTLGLLYGRGENESEEKHEFTYDRVRDFMSRFEALHGSITCRKLLDDIDLNKDEGQERFKAENWRETCANYVADAARILDELIDEHPKE
jgi:C_GCAxxG_C_C family probable redox protein